jgi:hypothetical protein
LTWGERVRLAGGHLAHRAGADQGTGTRLLAHGDYAWCDSLRPAPGDAPECPRCVRRLPELERITGRALAEDIARRCDCGRLAWWPGFRCEGCGTAVGRSAA